MTVVLLYGGHVTFIIAMLLWRPQCYFDDRQVALMVAKLLWRSAYYFDDLHVTLMMVVLLSWRSCYLDHRVILMFNVTLMIVKLLEWSSCHCASTLIQCKVEVSTELLCKPNWMTVITVTNYMYGFYTSLKNWKPWSFQKWQTSWKVRLHRWGLNLSTGNPNRWLIACYDFKTHREYCNIWNWSDISIERRGAFSVSCKLNFDTLFR